MRDLIRVRRQAVFAVCALLFPLLSSCAPAGETLSPDDYELYYAAQLDTAEGGDAIRAEPLYVDGAAAMDTAALAETLVRALLAAPEDDDLRSPFPNGTSLQKLSVAGGRATVDLSRHYGRLSGVDLSIADACLTLTLTQLPGIYAVRVTANGQELPYRRTQLFTAADALLSGTEDVIRPIDVSLYFLDRESGALRAQPQTLGLYEGQTRVNAVVEALRRGPSGDDTLQRLLDDGFIVLSSRTDGKMCYVNLSGAALPEDEALRAAAFESLVRSLLSLSGVEDVQLLVDGEAVSQWSLDVMAAVESVAAPEAGSSDKTES